MRAGVGATGRQEVRHGRGWLGIGGGGNEGFRPRCTAANGFGIARLAPDVITAGADIDLLNIGVGDIALAVDRLNVIIQQ